LHDVVVWSGASTGQCFYSHKGEDLDFTPEGFGTIEMFPLVSTVVRWRSDRSTSCFDDLEAREAAEDEEAESVALEKDDGHFMQPVEYSERGESARGVRSILYTIRTSTTSSPTTGWEGTDIRRTLCVPMIRVCEFVS
jgi:hypothetical protein